MKRYFKYDVLAVMLIVVLAIVNLFCLITRQDKLAIAIVRFIVRRLSAETTDILDRTYLRGYVFYVCPFNRVNDAQLSVHRWLNEHKGAHVIGLSASTSLICSVFYSLFGKRVFRSEDFRGNWSTVK